MDEKDVEASWVSYRPGPTQHNTPPPPDKQQNKHFQCLESLAALSLDAVAGLLRLGELLAQLLVFELVGLRDLGQLLGLVCHFAAGALELGLPALVELFDQALVLLDLVLHDGDFHGRALAASARAGARADTAAGLGQHLLHHLQLGAQLANGAGGGIFVDNRLVHNALGPVGVAQRAHRLLKVVGRRRQCGDHHRLAIAAQILLQKPGEHLGEGEGGKGGGRGEGEDGQIAWRGLIPESR